MTRSLACLLIVGFVGAAFALRRVCYYTNWAQYRNGAAKFYPENVDPSLCTHFIYAYAKLSGNHLAAYEWNDESTPWMKGMYERFNTTIRSANPSAKTLLSVGGWYMASAPFTALVKTASGRQEFCRTSVQFLRKHGFDGLDIDWKYPANRGSPPRDKQRFVELLQECRNQFEAEAVLAGKNKLLLASAVAAGKDIIDTGYNIPEVSRLLDMIHIMTYDLHGSTENHTGHHSALYSRTGETGDDLNRNVDWAAQYWISGGADRAKINLGVPLYGRSFKLSGRNQMIGGPASGAGTAGQYTRKGGFLAYYEICKQLASGATKYYEAEQKVPYYTRNGEWVGYEDTDSVRTKVDYILNNNFGGVMVWALDLDDFSGSCGQGKYPLMHAIVDESIVESPLSTTTTRKTTQGSFPPNLDLFPDRSMIRVSSQEFDCTGHGEGYYENPNSCSSFYICAAGVTFKSDCHPGLLYSRASGYCDFPDHVTCHSNNLTLAPIIAQRPVVKTNASPAASGTKDFCKEKEDGNYANPNDCAMYYTCLNGIATEEACSFPFLFDTAIQGCNWADKVTLGSGSGAGADHDQSISQIPPDQFDCSGRVDGYYANPTSCASYYICVSGMRLMLGCHPGLLYNEVSGYCDFPDHVTCTTHSTQDPAQDQTTTTRSPTTTSTAATVKTTNPTDFCRGKSDGYYSDPVDCAFFYQCSFEITYHEPCPSGTYFDEKMEGCNWKDMVTCP